MIEEFDHFTAEYVPNRHAIIEKIRQEDGPVSWCPRYGGYWLVVGHEETMKVFRDWRTFTSSAVFDENGQFKLVDGIRRQGVFLKTGFKASPILEADPPIHNQLRAILNPLLTPGAVERRRQRIQELADACLDRHVASGKIDISGDLTTVVAAIVTLELLGVSPEPYSWMAPLHNRAPHMSDEAALADEAMHKALATEQALLSEAIDARETDRGEDVVSLMLNARDKGEPVTRQLVMELASLLIAAGIDTTGWVMAAALVALSRQPELRDRLMSEPDLWPSAFEEFVRYASPVQGLCRTVTADVELGGKQLRKGDRIMLSYAASSRDPNAFQNPDEVILDRTPNQHTGFGGGIHRCMGSFLARLEFEVVLKTVLRRIPDYKVDLEQTRLFELCGVVLAYENAPATFTPSRPLGVDPRIKGWTPVTG